MPVYKYFGFPAQHHGKPLFHILSNLKNFGVGRIITRSSYETEEKKVAGPSFYRILWVQPLMDQESLLGSVVAEKVRNGVKYTEPVNLQDLASVPDFKLVSRQDEAEFCQWEKIRDFSVAQDFVKEPKYYNMPPLLRLLMERNLAERREAPHEESFLLPHYKTYLAKNVEVTPVTAGRSRVEKHQETVTLCEGTASHNYSDNIRPDLRAGAELQDILAQLPPEPPMPAPAVGMRLYHWPDSSRRHKEEIRTDQHDTFYP